MTQMKFIGLDAKEQILNETKSAEVVEIRIPGWTSVELSQGLHWLQSSIYEGFKVDYRTE
jgi:hypothetical protein